VERSAAVQGNGRSKLDLCILFQRLASWSATAWNLSIFLGGGCRVQGRQCAKSYISGERPSSGIAGWRGAWIERIGSEGTRPALLPAGPVPERWNVKVVFIETPDGPAINWTRPFALFLSWSNIAWNRNFRGSAAWNRGLLHSAFIARLASVSLLRQMSFRSRKPCHRSPAKSCSRGWRAAAPWRNRVPADGIQSSKPRGSRAKLCGENRGARVSCAICR
jgi:hypothetical protein